MMYPWYQAHWQALLLLQAALGTWVFAYGLKRRPHFVGRAAFSLMAGAFLAEGTTRLLWHFSGWAQLLTVSLIYGLLILVGFIYVCEAMSDILQVSYFKLTHGKRLFKMAPIHHHFEKCGWKEEKVVFVFAGVAAFMCILAWFGISGLIG